MSTRDSFMCLKCSTAHKRCRLCLNIICHCNGRKCRECEKYIMCEKCNSIFSHFYNLRCRQCD